MAYPQLKLDNQLCFRLYTAARLATACYTPYFRQYGITYPQYLVLMLLWEQDNRIISEITERLHLETNTVTPLLQRMEEQIQEVPNCLAREFVESGMIEEELQSMIPLLDKFIQVVKELY